MLAIICCTIDWYLCFRYWCLSQNIIIIIIITGKHITFSRWPVSLQPFDWSLEGTLSIRCWQPVKYYQSFHIVTESAQNKSTNTKTNFIIKISNVLNSSSGLTEYHFYVSIISAYSYVSVFRVWHCSLSPLTGLPWHHSYQQINFCIPYPIYALTAPCVVLTWNTTQGWSQFGTLQLLAAYWQYFAYKTGT